ncbi:MAG TPA: hypothetical protein VLJ39_01725, partial [Tepidisphaeraceae bacterium]|nr:hypothetical protein [Tepidisphaeraceae bacterium]
QTIGQSAAGSRRTLAAGQLADVFGIDIAGTDVEPAKTPAPAPKTASTPRKTAASKRAKARAGKTTEGKSAGAKSLQPEKPRGGSRQSTRKTRS